MGLGLLLLILLGLLLVFSAVIAERSLKVDVRLSENQTSLNCPEKAFKNYCSGWKV